MNQEDPLHEGQDTAANDGHEWQDWNTAVGVFNVPLNFVDSFGKTRDEARGGISMESPFGHSFM